MVNKIIFVSLMVLSGVCMNAQPVAKSFSLGGDISLYFIDVKINNEIENKLKITYFRILPKVSYYITDRTAIGLQTGIEIQKNNSEAKRNQTLFSIAPLLRYYLTSGKVGIFAEGQGKISFGNIKESIYEETEKGTLGLFSIGISPGLYYYISPKIALEFSAGWLGYSYQWEEFRDEKRTTNSFGFDIETTGLSLGVTFTL